MRWMRFLVILTITPLWAVAATFVWNGTAGDGAYSNPANWSGGVAPPNDGTAVLVFAGSGAGEILLPESVRVSQLRFEGGAGQSYQFVSARGSKLTLEDGVVSSINSGSARFDDNVAIHLSDAQTFSLNGGQVEVDGPIIGFGSITKSGVGTLKLDSINLFTGGVNHTAGVLALGPAGNLGFGTLRVSGGTLAFSSHQHSFVLNPVVFEGNAAITGTFDHYAVFAGPITLGDSVTLTVNATSSVFLAGEIRETGGPRQLTISGMAPVVLSGESNYTGGTRVENGVVIFGSRHAVPEQGSITSSALGYVGAGFSDNVQASFLDRLSATDFLGIIGFDTPAWGAGPRDFSDRIDVSGLANYTSIGSQTWARITGEVKVGVGEDYKFGGGGGTLYLESNLTARGENLQLISPFGDPLTLVLRGTNAFSGAANVLNSVLVLDHKNVVSKDTPLNLVGPGYIGATERAELSMSTFLGRISRIGSPDAIVGIDSATATMPRRVTEAIDLSHGGTRTDPYYLGTSTRVTLTGTITPTVGDALYLTAVKGGYLQVQSQLTANIPAVVIGQANSFDRVGGTVELAGNNTYAGGTSVRGGTLLVSNSQALGMGGVTVGDRATLSVNSGVTLNNTLSLQSGSRLSGSGTFSPMGGVFLANGAILSPGGRHSVGVLNFGSGLTLGSGGILEFDIRATAGGAWDLFNVTSGGVNLTATSDSPFVISLNSVNSSGNVSLLTDFDASQAYSWQFVNSLAGFDGFNAGQFSFDTTNFLNGTNGGAFFVSQSGNSLLINFTPVPEPSTYVLMAIGLGLVALLELRRRRR